MAETGSIASVSFFSALSDEQRAVLLQSADVVQFSAGATIFETGDPGDSLYIVKQGAVEISITDASGQRMQLEQCRPGGFFGELSLLDGGPRTARAVATEPLTAFRVDRNHLGALVSAHPEAAILILGAMGRRLRLSGDLLRRTASRNPNHATAVESSRIQRIVHLIAEFSGSLAFLFLHLGFFIVWIGLNVTWPFQGAPRMPMFDPFPFGGLTMIVSLEAIVLSVLVLFSQDRQASRDRVRADIEYDVNLKAELEVNHLHEKLDSLTSRLLARLEAIEKRCGKG
jgi:CRP/FNR family cyclic AMP-dependent transcriptional regulator